MLVLILLACELPPVVVEANRRDAEAHSSGIVVIPEICYAAGVNRGEICRYAMPEGVDCFAYERRDGTHAYSGLSCVPRGPVAVETK